jgi:hypothetical protein
VLAGVIDKNLSHHSCGQRKEVRAVLPFDGVVFGESQVSFVYQSRRLQRISR